MGHRFHPDPEVETLYSIKQLLFEMVRLQRATLHVLLEQNNQLVTGGSVSQTGNFMPLVPLAPGQSPQFTITPLPAGVATLAAQAAWVSSDPASPITQDPTDPTGTVATVAISDSDTVGEEISFSWTYTNADGTTANVAWTISLVSGTITPVDVTGGTVEQTA